MVLVSASPFLESSPFWGVDQERVGKKAIVAACYRFNVRCRSAPDPYSPLRALDEPAAVSERIVLGRTFRSDPSVLYEPLR